MTRGWGFKIDYASAIADDEVRIAWAERSIKHALWSRVVPSIHHGTFTILTLLDLVMWEPSIGEALGYSKQDLADVAGDMDYDVWARHPDMPEARHIRQCLARVKEIAADIDNRWLFKDEAEAKKELKTARASLSRHKRNRAVYGDAC